MKTNENEFQGSCGERSGVPLLILSDSCEFFVTIVSKYNKITGKVLLNVLFKLGSR